MTHSRKLPKDILERSDSEVVEMLLGKRVKKGLDKVSQAFEKKTDYQVHGETISGF